MELLARRNWRIAIFFIFVLIIINLLWLLKPLFAVMFTFLKIALTPFLIAMVISYLLHPLVDRLQARKVPRSLAIVLLFGTFIAGLTLIVRGMIPVVIDQIEELREHAPQFKSLIRKWLDGLVDQPFMLGSIRDGIDGAIFKMETTLMMKTQNSVGLLSHTLEYVLVAFLIPFLVFYMLKDLDLIEKSVLAFVPSKRRKSTIRLLREIDSTLGKYVRGQLTVCILIGFLAYLGYWLIGMPYPLLLAGIVAVLNIIPYLGPLLAAAPAIFIAATISWKMVLLVLLINFICQILEGNVIGPNIIGKSLHLHPLVIMFALLVGGELAGIVGLILVVPLLAVVRVIYEFRKSQTPVAID
jgi:predicted PurR-regulated permease PerM